MHLQSSVQLTLGFHTQRLVSVLLLECHMWSAVPISACTGGESVVALQMSCSLAATDQCLGQGWTGCKYRFSSLWYDPTSYRSSLPPLVPGAQSVRPFSLLKKSVLLSIILL